MLASMAQAVDFFGVFMDGPIKFSALDCERIGNIEVDQDVWIGDPLPHLGYIRMLLGDMLRLVTESPEPLDQSRFTSGARSDDADGQLFHELFDQISKSLGI